MPKLGERLTRYRQINIAVVGRKSGKTIPITVWFVAEGERLYLLPVVGSDTQWYRNLLHNPHIDIDVRGCKAKLLMSRVTEPKVVREVVKKFCAKYGKSDIKKYYANTDAAVVGIVPTE